MNPITRHHAFLLGGIFAALVFAPQTALGQGQKPSPAQVHGATLLKRSIKKMSRLKSVRFQTTSEQDAAFTRQMKKQMEGLGGGGMLEEGEAVIGSLVGDILKATVDDSGVEYLTRRRRTIARDGGRWKLHNGEREAFVLDPSLLFAAIDQVPAKKRVVTKLRTKEVREQKRLVVSFTVEGSAARDFVSSGCQPKINDPMAAMGGMMKKMAAMGAMGAGPEELLDFAFEIDPKTGYVFKIRIATYSKSNMPMPGMMAAGPGGGAFGDDDDDEDDDEEEEESDDDESKGFAPIKTGKTGPVYKKSGLPSRKVGETVSKASFVIKFSKHGKADRPKLDATARRLLLLPPATGAK